MRAGKVSAARLKPEEFALGFIDASMPVLVPTVQESDEALTYQRAPSFSQTWDG